MNAVNGNNRLFRSFVQIDVNRTLDRMALQSAPGRRTTRRASQPNRMPSMNIRPQPIRPQRRRNSVGNNLVEIVVDPVFVRRLHGNC